VPIEVAKEILGDVVTVKEAEAALGITSSLSHKPDILWFPEGALQALAGHVYVVPTVFELRELMGSAVACHLMEVNEHALALSMYAPAQSPRYRLILKDLPSKGKMSRERVLTIARLCGLKMRRMDAPSAITSTLLAKAVLAQTLSREYVTSTRCITPGDLKLLAIGPHDGGRIGVRPIWPHEGRRELIEFTL
jgi:hypothetical protein